MKHFVLVDCNNFYVSCERLFNPKIEGKPVVVLSNNDGCVVSRSQEAKQLGIKMGEPMFKIRDFCRQRGVIVYSSNYQIYGNISSRIMHTLFTMAPEIQIYSIDEAFLTFPKTYDRDFVYNHCVDIRRTIKKWVGIPISVGIGPTKTLAKAANKCAKKDRIRGIFDLSCPKLQEKVLKDFPIEDIWGIGRGLSARLHAVGIYTAEEFRQMEPTFVRRKLGVVGERMLWELRGISCLPLEEQAAAKQSITCSRSFGCTVTKESDLAEALATFVNTACIKLRKQESCAQALCVFLEAVLDEAQGTRQHFSTTMSFSMPSSDTPYVIAAAHCCLAHLFRDGQKYKKCGVILIDILPEMNVVPDLFLGPIHPKRTKLMKTVDALNDHFGKNTLFYAAMGVSPHWKMRSTKRSLHYTTEWEELPIVKAC